MAEAEPAVAHQRPQHDPVTRLGIPARVTVLFPFVLVSEIRDDVMARLPALFRTVPPFTQNFRGRTPHLAAHRHAFTRMFMAPRDAQALRGVDLNVVAAFRRLCGMPHGRR